MPPMPYYLEKGPMLSVIESYVNDDVAHAVTMLRALRIPAGGLGHTELWDLAPFKASTLVGKPGNPYWQDFRDKWCGKGPNLWNGVMWIDYVGDVEGITRLSIRRALETSLGVGTNDDVPDRPPRHWPLDLYWKCGQNWFEGWVAYRRWGTGARDGHVALTFCTPSEGSIIVDRPASHVRLHLGPDFEVDPPNTLHNGLEREAGLMVVTHRHNKATPRFQVPVTGIGQPFNVVLNPTVYVGEQGLVVVAPAEADGGVLAQPRPYAYP